jgi:hypothetical protein
VTNEPAHAAAPGECERDDLACFQDLYESECEEADATLETCLVFLQRLETARRGSSSAELALLLGDTLHDLARQDLPPEAKTRYLARSRAAYRQAIRVEPFSAAGYLGLAEVAETGEERVDWLRGAVRAEYRPAHMELLANTLATEIGGHTGDLEAARVLEDAYTYETTNTEKWRYGVAAWRGYTDAALLYPSAVSGRALENVVLRIHDDIDYPLLQRALLDPEAHLPYLADAFATLCEKSIVVIFDSDECMAGLELAVVTAEGPVSAGTRRWLAEAVLNGMRTIAGESLPQSAEALRRFPDWLMRLLATQPEPADVAADLLEALADYTVDLPDRAERLLAAIELVPNRGDLRLKAGATYVELGFWLEALEQLWAAKIALPPEEHARVDELAAKADERYQARFFPPDVVE